MARLILIVCLLLAPSAWADEVATGVLRTPDARFDGLAGYPFEPNYMTVEGLRIHYLDEGPRDGDPILLIHGQPTWSYLFRKMIPVLTAAGHRVIVPDMVGFGRSDKFMDKHAYSYQFHVDTMTELVQRLDLQNATFFGQDWGGLVGLRVVAEQPDRFARVMVSNTGLPSATGIRAIVGYPIVKLMTWWHGPLTIEEFREEPSFPRWIAYSYYGDDLAVDQIMEAVGGITDPDAITGYVAPFPDGSYKAGAQIFPYLIPSQLSENEDAWRNIFEKWEKPFLVAFTDSDPVTSATDFADQFETRVPGATRVVIKGIGHFVQEEVGPELAALMNDFIAGNDVEGF
eukprot:s1_g2271.t1